MQIAGRGVDHSVSKEGVVPLTPWSRLKITQKTLKYASSWLPLISWVTQ